MFHRIRAISSSNWFHWPFLGAAVCLCVYWYLRPPVPNKAVLAIGVVAVVMTLTEMKASHKAAWLVIVFTLAFLENRAINKERTDSETERRLTRKEERDSFQSIADGIKASINQGQQQFAETMQKYELLNKQTTEIEKNSAKRAELAFDRVWMPMPLSTQYPVYLNLVYGNVGNARAIGVGFDARVFISSDDPWDTKTNQQSFAKGWKEFSDWIKSRKHTGPGGVLEPTKMAFFTTTSYPAPTVTDDDIAAMQGGRKFIFVRAQIRFKDDRGDRPPLKLCVWLQPPIGPESVTHYCATK